MTGKHYMVFLSTLGILLLYFLSSISQPISIDIEDIQKHEGEKVRIEGIVTNYYLTRYGNQIITLESNNTTITIFVEEKINVEYGDEIQVFGQVQKYRDTWRIYAEKENAVTIVKKWQNLSHPLWELGENPARYNGLNINTTGYVDRIYSTYFYIVDSEEKHSLIVFYNPSNLNISLKPGQKVTLFGKFVYDENTFRYKLDINEGACIIEGG